MSTKEDAIKSDAPLRETRVAGAYYELPKVGSAFVFLSTPLTEGCNLRTITTSTVKSVRTYGRLTFFETQNSKYALEHPVPVQDTLLA